jgi:hypothetical protein
MNTVKQVTYTPRRYSGRKQYMRGKGPRQRYSKKYFRRNQPRWLVCRQRAINKRGLYVRYVINNSYATMALRHLFLSVPV